MKKTFEIIIILSMIFSLFIFSSCRKLDNNSKTVEIEARKRTVINLPRGEKLIQVDLKGNEIVYVTETMEPDYEPKRRIVTRQNSFGAIWKTTIIFVEKGW